MSSTFLCRPDYLNHIEPCLETKCSSFFKKCNNFESQVECLQKVIKKYYLEENYNASEDPVPVVVDHSTCMRKEYEELVQKFNGYSELKELLDSILEYSRNEDFEQEPVDLETIGLSNREQKHIWIERIRALKNYKEIGRKILKKLTDKLKLYEIKAHDASFSALIISDFHKSQVIPIKHLENGVNMEVTRLKNEFTKKYEKLFLLKLKCEKIDWVMRTEMIPKITKLETSLMTKRLQLETVQKEKADCAKQEIIQMKIDDEYEKKWNAMMKVYEQVVQESDSTSLDIKKLKKSYVRTHKSIQQQGRILKENLTSLLKNSEIDQEAMEIDSDKLNFGLCYSKNSTLCQLSHQDVIIMNLKFKICKLLQGISNSTEFIKVLENDVKFLRNEHQKYSIGRDYMGNTFLSPRIKSTNI